MFEIKNYYYYYIINTPIAFIYFFLCQWQSVTPSLIFIRVQWRLQLHCVVTYFVQQCIHILSDLDSRSGIDNTSRLDCTPSPGGSTTSTAVPDSPTVTVLNLSDLPSSERVNAEFQHACAVCDRAFIKSSHLYKHEQVSRLELLLLVITSHYVSILSAITITIILTVVIYNWINFNCKVKHTF